MERSSLEQLIRGSLVCCISIQELRLHSLHYSLFYLVDIAFYGLGLNSSIVLTNIGFGNTTAKLDYGKKIYVNLHNVSVGNLILSAAGLIPGYWVSFLFIDSVRFLLLCFLTSCANANALTFLLVGS